MSGSFSRGSRSSRRGAGRRPRRWPKKGTSRKAALLTAPRRFFGLLSAFQRVLRTTGFTWRPRRASGRGGAYLPSQHCTPPHVTRRLLSDAPFLRDGDEGKFSGARGCGDKCVPAWHLSRGDPQTVPSCSFETQTKRTLIPWLLQGPYQARWPATDREISCRRR
jgi:hypothetical protein